VLLILTAFISTGVMVLTIAVVRPRFSTEWAKFIYTSIGYLVLLISIAYPEYYKRLVKWKVLFFQFVYYVLTTSIAFALFKNGLLELPKGMLTYVLPMIVLLVASIIILDKLSKRSGFFKK
jgi:hypothetical protein